MYRMSFHNMKTNFGEIFNANAETTIFFRRKSLKALLFGQKSDIQISKNFNSKIKVKISNFDSIFQTPLKQLTYPSGWSLIKSFFLLKEIFLIFAHENVLMRVMPWKTASPMWATARLRGTPSWSLAACIFMPYSSHRRAVSRRFKSASAGDCPLKVEKTCWDRSKNRAARILPVLLVVFHDSPLHRVVLLRHKSIWRQVSVVGIVFVRVIAARCWNDSFVQKKSLLAAS